METKYLLTGIKRISLRKILPATLPGISWCALLLLSLFYSITFSSCFTGIEGTKKVSLSREDRKNLEPTEEELYFKGVASQPLSDWAVGKKFMAADNKTILIFNQQGLPSDPDEAALQGKILYYKGTESKLEPDGTKSVSILFGDNDGKTYRYDSGKKTDEAMAAVNSAQIPMMIDLDMIAAAGKLLQGNTYWIRTPLWYDNAGNRITARKFVPVTISEVSPGNIAFPMKLRITTEDGKHAFIFMNFGNSATETRTFANLFYLTDLRKKYPSISDDVWEVICNGSVKLGMTKDECKLSIGTPTEVNRGHDYSQTLDIWQYPNGTVLWFEDGLLSRFRR